jgi:hypothetical protein
MPGSSHALVPESSLDSFRQESLQRTVVSNEISQVMNDIAMPINPDNAKSSKTSDELLPNQPFLFVSDTDSIDSL